MKFLITTLLFLFLHIAGNGQNIVTDSTTTIIAYWNKGDKCRLSYNANREKFQDGKFQSRNITTGDIDMLIVDADDTSYTIEWKYSKIKSEGEQQFIWEFNRGYYPEGLDIKYTTDETGSFKEIQNWEAIRDHIYRAMDEFPKQKNSNPVNDIQKAKQLFASKESVEIIIARDIQLYHSIYGAEYKLHEKINSQIKLPNFIGGDPFTAQAYVELTDLNPNVQYCKIESGQVLNKEEVTRRIENWLKKNNKDAAKFNMPLMSITDYNVHEIELKAGWGTRAFYRRILESGNRKNIDIYELIKL